MDVVDKIADLILLDPSISVRELAKRLGYAEEKTIYYWIAKRGYRGIRAFKRAVLTGHFRGRLVAREPGTRPGRLPMAERLGPHGEPILTGETIPITLDRGRGTYVLHYAGPSEANIIAGDYLVIGPVDLDQADWALTIAGGQPAVRRVIRTGGARYLLDMTRGNIDHECLPIGTILQIARILSPATP